MLTAGLHVRELRAEQQGVSERRLPSMTDALFAHRVTADPEVRLVVTDDARDFHMLAPDFAGRVLSVQDFIQALAG